MTQFKEKSFPEDSCGCVQNPGSLEEQVWQYMNDGAAFVTTERKSTKRAKRGNML